MAKQTKSAASTASSQEQPEKKPTSTAAKKTTTSTRTTAKKSSTAQEEQGNTGPTSNVSETETNQATPGKESPGKPSTEQASAQPVNTGVSNTPPKPPVKAGGTKPEPVEPPLPLWKRPITIWLFVAGLFTISLAWTYICMHNTNQEERGKQQVEITKEQIGELSKLIQSNLLVTVQKSSIESCANSSASTDSTANTKKKVCTGDTTMLITYKMREDRAISYLNSILDPKCEKSIERFVKKSGVDQVVSLLPNHKFEVDSYFWLMGYWILIEVIFWSLFGLMANLMYSVTKAKEFDKALIKEHIGKVFYTPLVSIVIYLSLQLLIAEGDITLEADATYVVVLAFLLGFFTRRTIKLLTKVKRLIFPDESDANEPKKKKVLLKGTVTMNDPTVTPEIFKQNVGNTKFTISKNGKPLKTVNANSAGSIVQDLELTAGSYTWVADLSIDTVNYSANGTIAFNGTDKNINVDVLLAKVEG